MTHSKEQSKSVETILGKAWMSDILDKHFGATVWKLLTELKENRDEVKKTMYEKMRISLKSEKL